MSTESYLRLPQMPNMDDEPRERRYLIRRPRALQYFHNGQLKKAAEKERVAGRFELFLDLLYVALVRAMYGLSSQQRLT